MGSALLIPKNKGRVVWRISKVVVLAGREKCSRRPAQNVRKNAKFLLSPEKTVRYIARTAFRSVKIAAVN
jgi:hypothetical protein